MLKMGFTIDIEYDFEDDVGGRREEQIEKTTMGILRCLDLSSVRGSVQHIYRSFERAEIKGKEKSE